MEIEIFKIKKIIKELESFTGTNTSMISLIIPPKTQLNLTNKMLTQEYSAASNIKSSVNKTSVLTAISLAQQKLKLYSKTPDNGLALFIGIDSNSKKISIDFEPYRPINTSLYMCDNKFHTEIIKDLISCNETFAFIIIDGKGTLFGTLTGNSKKILQQVSVSLPNKHSRGGQSALRFARLRVEKRHNYITKIAEMSNQLFIIEEKIDIKGIFIAGSADFKTVLYESNLFDKRLKEKVIKVLDIGYGGNQGFNHAITNCQEDLKNVGFIKEIKVLSNYFDEIAQDGKYTVGLNQTMDCFNDGNMETIIVNAELNEQDLLEYIIENSPKFNTELQLVTDKSSEGSQFVKGFGGIGGISRFKLTEIQDSDFESNYDSE